MVKPIVHAKGWLVLQRIKQWVWETGRCTRHNLLSLKIFRLRFDGKLWHVTDREGLHLRFPFYPFLVFYEIEGYLRQGQWPLTEGMTVIDAGGCFGEFSLYASRKVGKSGRVIMLEPDPENIRRAEEYFAFNGEKPANVELINAGLWNTSGVIRFAAGLGSDSAILEPGEIAPPGAQVEQIAVESLESLAQRCNLQRIDLVKIDIEGAEVEVIESAGDCMMRFKPRFSVASYHLREQVKTSQLIEPVFKRLSYQTVTGFAGHQTTWGWP